MTLLLDAGAFLAIERDRRDIVALIKRELIVGSVPVTHGGVVGQVWRGGTGRQARLSLLLKGVDVRPLDGALGRSAGVLLGQSRTSDIVDAGIVRLAEDGDEIITSDTSDLRPLAEAADLHIDLIPA